MLTFPPDITFVIQIASFLILWFGLKRLLFDPVLQLLEAREARTTGLAREAADMKTSAERSATEYERRMQEVRHGLSVEAEKGRATTQDEERRLIAEARQHASTQLMQLRETLSRQAQAARPALAADARDLAVRMLDRVVGKKLA